MESKPGRNVIALVAMVDLVEPPKEFKLVSEVVPDIDGEVEQDEAQDPFEGTVGHASKETIIRVVRGHDEKTREREHAHKHIVYQKSAGIR